jgi:hypothetical protein
MRARGTALPAARLDLHSSSALYHVEAAVDTILRLRIQLHFYSHEQPSSSCSPPYFQPNLPSFSAKPATMLVSWRISWQHTRPSHRDTWAAPSHPLANFLFTRSESGNLTSDCRVSCATDRESLNTPREGTLVRPLKKILPAHVCFV